MEMGESLGSKKNQQIELNKKKMKVTLICCLQNIAQPRNSNKIEKKSK
jgi:hypothetical protein